MLMEKYNDRVYKTVYSVLRNEKDAEDAAQEVFIKIYSSLHKYEGKGFPTWVTRISVNHAIDIKRKKDRRKEDVTEDIGEYFKTIHSEGLEDSFLKKEMKELVHRRLQEVPENYRHAVYGYYIEEKSMAQLAQEQGLKEKSIRVKLHRARKWMREHWKEDDFS